MNDLGTLGGTSSDAWGINNIGQVVGYSDIAGDTTFHAFLYSNGNMLDLGTLGGSSSGAFSINIHGQVVGGAYNADEVETAFLYSDGLMMDLNSLINPDSGWYLDRAFGINDSGQIVGTGYINGEERAYLLTISAVPVLASAWLLGSGLIGLMGAVRRQKAN